MEKVLIETTLSQFPFYFYSRHCWDTIEHSTLERRLALCNSLIYSVATFPFETRALDLNERIGNVPFLRNVNTALFIEIGEAKNGKVDIKEVNERALMLDSRR